MTRKGTRPRNPRNAETAIVAGVGITHPAKIWWPEEGITKLDVARYYASIAPHTLPWLKNHPLTAERCPNGIEGECFFQKDFSHDLPAGVPTYGIATEDGSKTVHYVIGGLKETLLNLVNLGCIAVHIMNCRVHSRDRPDWLAFDLDPSSGSFSDAARAATVLREVLKELRIVSYPKTSGARGLHVLVPLRSGPDQEQVRIFAHRICHEMAQREPKLVTVQMRKSKRRGKVFADWIRNAFGQTIVSPYSLRCHAGAPVSAPLDWDEVDPELNPLSFNLHTMERRLAGEDPWADFWRRTQTLPNLDNDGKKNFPGG